MKNSICDKFFGLNFTKTEYVAHKIELTSTHKSPFVNVMFIILKKSPLSTKNTTPIVDKSIPIIWYFVISLFKIRTDKIRINIGIIELISSAFVAVVVFKAMYKTVLKSVIPIIDKKDNIKKFSFIVFSTFLKSIKNKIGKENKITKSHLKKANSSGSTSVLINLPKIKFPDQKSTQSTNNG